MNPPEGRDLVLVVDDEPFILEALELILCDHWNVVTASSAAEGRAVLQREDVAVIVSDARMPVETGVDLLSWAVVNAPDAIRILLTGYTNVEMVVEAINKGKIWHYVRKPWDNQQVVMLLQRAVEYRNKDLEARRRFEGSIRSLVVALETSHPYTSGHSTRVTRYSTLLCDALGLGGRERELVVLAAQLHDIGKIGVDNRYLDKAGALTPDEWRSVRNHVDVGRRILEGTGFLDGIIPLVMTHHERLDGTGYPRGLPAEDIPLGGRIIALADAFDAMTSFRAYRDAMPVPAALAELRRCAGTQFDPVLVEAFHGLATGGRLAGILDPGPPLPVDASRGA